MIRNYFMGFFYYFFFFNGVLTERFVNIRELESTCRNFLCKLFCVINYYLCNYYLCKLNVLFLPNLILVVFLISMKWKTFVEIFSSVRADCRIRNNLWVSFLVSLGF